MNRLDFDATCARFSAVTGRPWDSGDIDLRNVWLEEVYKIASRLLPLQWSAVVDRLIAEQIERKLPTPGTVWHICLAMYPPKVDGNPLVNCTLPDQKLMALELSPVGARETLKLSARYGIPFGPDVKAILDELSAAGTTP